MDARGAERTALIIVLLSQRERFEYRKYLNQRIRRSLL
jgi:hypothetical protein